MAAWHKGWLAFLVLASFGLSGCQASRSAPEKDIVSSDSVKTTAEQEAGSQAAGSMEVKSHEEQERIRILIAEQHAKALAKRDLIPPPGDDPYRWIQDAQDVYGQYAPPSTMFKVTDEGNCGGPGGGCTVQLSDVTGPLEPVEIYISPTAIGSTHLLFHEIAHSHGILDECMAEKWAHTVTDIIEWSYLECAPE